MKNPVPTHKQINMCARMHTYVCVCLCVRVRACVRACVRVRARKTKRRTLNGRQIIMHLVSEEEKVRVMYYQGL